MKNQNKSISGYLTKVVHSNRNLAWAVAALLISGFSLSAYIYISGYNEDIDSVFSNLKSKKVYVDNDLKYLVSYPSGWVLEKDPSGNTVFSNPSNSAESITVTRTSLRNESLIRNYLNIRTENRYTLPKREIYIIKAGTAKDNSDIDVAIIKTALNLYYVTGHSNYFRTFVLNLRFF